MRAAGRCVLRAYGAARAWHLHRRLEAMTACDQAIDYAPIGDSTARHRAASDLLQLMQRR